MNTNKRRFFLIGYHFVICCTPLTLRITSRAEAYFIMGSSPTNACLQILYSTWAKRLSCNDSHQEVRRCCTRNASEESIECRWEITRAKDPPSLWNKGKMSPEVQNWGISGPTERLMCSKITNKKVDAINRVSSPCKSISTYEWMRDDTCYHLCIDSAPVMIRFHIRWCCCCHHWNHCAVCVGSFQSNDAFSKALCTSYGFISRMDIERQIVSVCVWPGAYECLCGVYLCVAIRK